MKRTAMVLVTFALTTGVPITAFAATTSTPMSENISSTQGVVQLRNLPVEIDGVKYAQNDPHVKNVVRFVFDNAAEAQGVVYGYTKKDIKSFNAQLQRTDVAHKKALAGNTITPSSVAYDSYFYWDINFGGRSFGASKNISWVGSTWNDKISSLKAGSNHTWTVMCWDVNYGGAEYWVESGIDVSYVGSAWNDQASSIFFTN